MFNEWAFKERDLVNFLLERGGGFRHLDETYIKLMSEHGFDYYHIGYEMNILAKNFYEKGYKPKEVKEQLISFFNLHNYAHREPFSKMLKRALKTKYSKYPNLIQVDSVPIYQHEVEYLCKLDLSQKYKRVLFAYLVLKKIHLQMALENGIENINLSKRVKDFTKFNNQALKKFSKAQNIEYLEHDLIKLGYLHVESNTWAQGVDAVTVLDFFDNFTNIESAEVMRVSDFTQVWLYFDYISGYTRNNKRKGRIILCKDCNKPLYTKSNATKYCSTCAKNRIKERDRARKNPQIENFCIPSKASV